MPHAARSRPVSPPPISPEKGLADKAPTNKTLGSDLNTSLFEGSCYSLMVGLGETYVPAFVIAVGLGEISSGLITSVPLLAGALLQMTAPLMVQSLGSYRKWVVLCASLQCSSFVFLTLAAFVGYLPAPLAFLIMAVYWGTGMAISPAWNSWMNTIVPVGIRASYFARRSRYTQAASLLGFLAGGWLLNSDFLNHRTLLGFGMLFTASVIFRGFSVWGLSRISEPVPPHPSVTKPLPLASMIACFRRETSGGKVLFYMLALQFAVYTSAPFVTPYLLGQLKFNYPQFAALVAASFAAKVVSLPWLGRQAARHGALTLLRCGGTSIVLIPVLWTVSTNFWYLLTLQAITGFFWAAYELASILLVLEKLGDEERIGMLTNYNLFNAMAVTLGSLVGASLLDGMGGGLRAYYVCFLVSGAARAVTLLPLRRVEMKPLRRLPFPLPTLEFRHFTGFVAPRLGKIWGWRKDKTEASTKNSSKPPQRTAS